MPRAPGQDGGQRRSAAAGGGGAAEAAAGGAGVRPGRAQAEHPLALTHGRGRLQSRLPTRRNFHVLRGFKGKINAKIAKKKLHLGSEMMIFVSTFVLRR